VYGNLSVLLQGKPPPLGGGFLNEPFFERAALLDFVLLGSSILTNL